MSINLTPFVQGELFYGNTWVVEDKEILAKQIARIALGYSRHIKKILSGVGVPIPASAVDNVTGALTLLTVDGGEPWHRDGWLFQTISYIAAVKDDPSGIYDSPHMQHTAKGLDGLKLEIDQKNGSVTSLVIFEDKATVNARQTIATKIDSKGKKNAVWDEFKDIESGSRQPLLTDKISSMLSNNSSIDADDAIEKLIWKEVRRYRISITVNDTHSTEDGRKRLFKGYEEVVGGELKRRKAETIQINNLRDWMDELAEMVKKYISEVNTNV
ncbi:hypothetical protein V6L80_04175 [Erwinia persicina]|uniref:hypothetical protein n=1 Tax=Erwinia persicina TaxID=55211 RepID=UPI0030CC83F7